MSFTCKCGYVIYCGFPFVCRCGKRYENETTFRQLPIRHIRLFNEVPLTTSFYPPTVVKNGCGDELQRIVARKGYSSSGCLTCLPLIQQMNEGGPDWCLANMDTVIVPVMVQEARNRKITVKILGQEREPHEFLLRIQARRWVKQAVRNYRAKELANELELRSNNGPQAGANAVTQNPS